MAYQVKSKNFWARRYCNESLNSNLEIFEEEGNLPPKSAGSSYFFTTLSGKTIISHPSSYGWAMKYHHSTRHIKVGKNWQPKIPKGMNLFWDTELQKAVLVRQTDGMEFHFDFSSTKRKNFCTLIRREMAKNYTKRLNIRRKNKFVQANLKNTYVLLEDSRRAGNCDAGTFAFAKRHLGVDNIDSWFTKVRADILMRTKNSLAMNAVRAAFERETQVSI